jgi:hypothetical protein
MLDDDALSDPPNLDQVLRQGASPRAWKFRWLVLGISVALIIAVIVSANWGSIAARIFPAYATYHIAFASDVSWAVMTLIIAGHRTQTVSMSQASISAASSQSSSALVNIQAPPFSPLTCTFILPATITDTCRDRDGHNLLRTSSSKAQLAIVADFTLQDMPAAQRSPLFALIEGQLRQTLPQVTVASGSHYTIGTYFRQTLVASQPLVATLQTSADVTTALYSSCPDLCAGVASSSPTNAPTWHARTFVQQQWQIARAADGLALGDTPENLVPHPVDFDLRYDPVSGQWSVVGPLTEAVESPLCEDGQIYLDSLFFTGSSAIERYMAESTIEQHALSGCLLHIAAVSGSSSADFLWRLGQLYAADSNAAAADPTLPVALPQDLAALPSSLLT